MIVIFTVKCLGIFGIAVFSLFISLTKDIKCDLNVVINNAKMEKTRLKTIKQLNAVIQFHSKAIQLRYFGIFSSIKVFFSRNYASQQFLTTYSLEQIVYFFSVLD